ncbi:12208_t:CDS:2 [Funneliformis geosporum]|uniref:12208_t:CDS:1 n=1 Tax=Funneliformis geosporum TaxID=1117311 RepID=A0A9W4WPQ2_9GLOM|nr:12208_t:CDS:2 [Funneliformis geosporum]
MNIITNFYQTLSNDLEKLISNVYESKVVNIKVGNYPSENTFQAHSNILIVRSPFFRDTLLRQNVVGKNNLIDVKIREIDFQTFPIILQYIYTGVVDLSNVVEKGLLDLLIGATLLQLEELSYHLQDYLITKHSTWVKQNYDQILTKTFKKRDGYVKLWDYCMQGICEDPKSLFSSEEFIKLDKDILFAILDQETLQCEELIIWEALIKWGIEQSPTISQKPAATSFDTNDWTDEEFIILKGIIEKFIPCIHFFEISSSDFYNKIRPFRPTLAPDLFDEVLGYHMKEKKPKLWPRLGKVDSVIIKSKQATAISNLIKNYELSSQNSIKKCSLSLLYRADRDGFHSGIFRNQCNDQGPSLALIKLRNGKIVGGYNPLGWMKVDPDDRKDYSKSFLFSFEPSLEVRSLKSVGVKNPTLAFDNQSQQALHFGTTDLIINGQNGSCVVRDFQSPIISSRSFAVENVEVFAVNDWNW